MINGFEKETGPLTNEEVSLAHICVKGFITHVGAENAITSDEIIFKLKGLGYKIDGPRLRKIVNFIRIKKMVRNLVATSSGYYVENDPEKLKLYVESLKARAAAITAVADSYK